MKLGRLLLKGLQKRSKKKGLKRHSQTRTQITGRAKTSPKRGARSAGPLSGILKPHAERPEAPKKGAEALPAKRPLPVATQVLPQEQPRASGGAVLTSELVRPYERLRESIEAFLLDQRSPHTQRAYGKDLKRFIQFLHARATRQGAEPLTRMVLIAYKDSLLAEGLEHTSIDRHLATLRSFFRWLVDDGHLTQNPAEGVRFLNPKKISRTQGFTDDEVKKILALPDLHTRTGSLHYAILMVLFYCGLRRSELCSLRTSQLTIERGHPIFRLKGKGNSERIVVLTPAAWNSIRHYFRITHRSLTQDQPLFVPMKNNRTGVLQKPMDPSAIFYVVTRYAKLAGIQHRVSPHSCRATAISNARDHQVPDRAIQEFAGWASPDMITRYDKRKSAIEKSAAHAISYGAMDRTEIEAVNPQLGSGHLPPSTWKPKLD